MDLRFSSDEIAFRSTVRETLRREIPLSIRRKVKDGRKLEKSDIVTAHKSLHRLGWAAPHWPAEWGGTDWGPIKTYIFNEELQAEGVPQPLQFNVSMCGPVLLQFGSEAQKRRFLPRMAALDDWWCQGFSEPGAGSDLASLKTTARRDGDDFIVDGQKTWTTLAQYADWIFCLVRTEPAAKKQQGISFLLIDMKTPGITVRPIVTIDGGREVNEVFFDAVRVPADNLVGALNRGWDCAKFLLGNERVGIARVGVSKQRLRRIKQLAGGVMSGDRPLGEDERFREKVAAVEVELKALEITQLRILADERRRQDGKPNPASSILKIKGSELQQATTELMLEVAGPLALPFAADAEDETEASASLRNAAVDHSDWAETIAPSYFNTRKVSIYGGSNEIQRNILAKAILGF
jgi:pimeloyl-CoA dehydrogenase large subunit